MRTLFIVIDGLADRPIKKLGNKTPLEAAKTPNLDYLAQKGICGLLRPWLKGEKPTSETSHLALFGYDPDVYYLGRGVYEAAGIGARVKKGDVCLRVNFATVDGNLCVIDRRAGRISETQILIKALSGRVISGVKFLLKKSYGHRAVLLLRCLTPGVKQRLSAKITDGDPGGTGQPVKQIASALQIVRDSVLCQLSRESERASFTAEILNQFLAEAHRILKNHSLNKKREARGLVPANYLLVRGAGQAAETPEFKKKYGLKPCCIAGGPLYKGIARILGMKVVDVRGANGLSTTNLKGKFSAAKKAVKNYDFVFLHIKAADTFAEDGDFAGKKAFIEKIDREMTPVLKLKNTLIVVTADHATCCELKRHCSEPVPVLIYGNGKNAVDKFSEKTCRQGGLGKIEALELMPRIISLTKHRN